MDQHLIFEDVNIQATLEFLFSVNLMLHDQAHMVSSPQVLKALISVCIACRQHERIS